MSEEKKELRKSTQKLLAELSAPTKQNAEEEIITRLFQLTEWNNANTVGVTVSRGNEINTYPIIEKAWAQGKTVAVPKCDPTDYSMVFRKLTSFDELETVYYGLKEPIVSKTEGVDPDQIDLLIVPGLLFDRKGFRIGFGGGFYDRFLMKYTGFTVSLAHSVQFTNSVPKESFDQPVNRLILPDKVHTTDRTS